jgi:hypothetical protein
MSKGRRIRSIRKKEKRGQDPSALAFFEFPKEKDGIIYVRQSSIVQMQKNIHSFEMQTDRFLEHFRNMGCTGNIEIVADDEALSGTLDIHQRPGLSRVMKMIEQEKIGWVGAVAVNRLTRDPWFVTPGTIMKECHEHNVWIATLRTLFNFRDPSGYSQRVFMLEAEEAARHLEWMKLILGGARVTASSNGYYDGRWLVPGYIVDRTDPLRKKYIIYEPHARVVRWLFKRFLELDANLYELCREVDRMPYLFPKFESWVDPKNVSKFSAKRSIIKEGPYQGNYKSTDHGIKGILCNPVYIGWWLPVDGGVIEDNHEPIVEEALFTYAHKRLSTYDLNGERQKPLRVIRTGTAAGVLKKVLRDSAGNPMYAYYDNSRDASFYKSIGKTGLSYVYEFSVHVERVDRTFLERFFERLEALEKLEDWEDKLEQRLADKLAAREESEKLIRKQISDAGRKRQEILDTLADPDIPKTKQMKIDYARQVAGLEDKIAQWQSELEAPEEEEGGEEVTLYQIHSLLPGIREKWEQLSTEVRMRFIGALVWRVVLVQVSPSWLLIEIHWKDAIGRFVDMRHFRRPQTNRSHWSGEEEAILRRMYPQEDAAVIVKALSRRSWQSIMARGERLGIKRERSGPNSINAHAEAFLSLCEEDRRYMEENGLSSTDTDAWSVHRAPG